MLMVEEYNPPCARMSKHLSETLTTASGDPLAEDASLRRVSSRAASWASWKCPDSCRPVSA